MSDLERVITRYASQVSRLAGAETTSELTYYPAIHELLSGLVEELSLRFEVRTSTTEYRVAGGIDLPDLALYDGAGDFVVVSGEVKPPDHYLREMFQSTDRNDQVGRYLARTRVILLSNVRGFALVVAHPGWQGEGPVPPDQRRFEQEVELWPSVAALRRGDRIDPDAAGQLLELVETALTRYAPIAEPETLARVLARQARRAKSGLPAQFGQAVQRLADDFGTALGITFEGEEGLEFFRSSLVQTVFYGLFAGWLLYARQWRAQPFRWQELNEYLRIPFLGGLFHEIENPTRLRELGLRAHLDLATETLARVHLDSFFRRLRQRGTIDGHRDEEGFTSAIVYFYEPFLETFDPVLRKQLGVWYTPPEIVRYQVRKVDRLLREELGCPLGFADERVVVLDPCCGTGAYLLEVLACMAETLQEEGVEAELGATLKRAVRERVLGFELLTAPFVVAHLQIYLLLADLGAVVGPEDRPGVFLTNALTGWRRAPQLNLAFPELNQEREAAQRIKTEARIIVMLGNPPYNRFAGAPIGEEQELVDPYKGISRDARGQQIGRSELFTRWGVRKHLLDELYIRFFRLAEERIGHHAEYGVVSFISNSSFLAGRSHPIMRECLLSGFDDVWVDQLHGNRIASERTPWGESCETIFSTAAGAAGIKVGTAVTTWVKGSSHVRDPAHTRVHVRDFWGRAEAKRSALLASLGMASWTVVELNEAAGRPEGPRSYESFSPTIARRWRLVASASSGGYDDWPSLDELFEVNFQGVNPNRGLEGSLIDTNRAALEERMRFYFSEASHEEVAARYPELMKARARYKPKDVRDLLRQKTTFTSGKIVPYLVFPLDCRFIYYETSEKLLNEHRQELWAVIEQKNELLLAVPQVRRPSEALPIISTHLFDLHLHDRGSVGFPADRLVEVPSALHGSDGPERVLTQNLNATVCAVLREHFGWTESSVKESTQALFRVVLALMYAPQYLEDHSESLAHDWARVPLPREVGLLRELVTEGGRIASLLDPWQDPRSTIRELLGGDGAELAKLARRTAGTVAEADLVVTISHYGAARGGWRPRRPGEGEAWRPEWGESTGDLFLNEEVCFRHVPAGVWQFELGGYPVIKKWLGYRESRRRNGAPLTLDEKNHLRSMVQRLAGLLVLRARLDPLYARAAENAFTVEELGLIPETR